MENILSKEEVADELEKKILYLSDMTENELYVYRDFVINSDSYIWPAGKTTQATLDALKEFEIMIIDIILENNVYLQNIEYKRGFAKGLRDNFLKNF